MPQTGQLPEIDVTLLAWADIVINKWKEKVLKFNLVRSGNLLNSLKHEFQKNSGGSTDKIEFSFVYYGIFHDRGTAFMEQKEWFNPIYYSQVMRLKEILQEKYQQNIGDAIKASLEKA